MLEREKQIVGMQSKRWGLEKSNTKKKVIELKNEINILNNSNVELANSNQYNDLEIKRLEKEISEKLGIPVSDSPKVKFIYFL